MMIRNLKALGLALIAVFAFSAMAASGASAGVLTSDGPVTLKGEETGELFANAFEGPLGRITCDGSTYTGHKYNVTPHEAVPSGASTVTVTPHYATNCYAHIPLLLGATRDATVTMNGCDYVFHIGAETGAAGTYGVTADIICPEGKEIEVHIYAKDTPTTHEAHTNAANSVCTIKIPEKNNAGLAGAHLTNGAGDVTLTGKFENVYTTNSGSLCGTGESETADLAADITIKGLNAEGGETGGSISG